MPNRLIDSTSPYLLQHAHNPVDWHPWDAHARALAKKQGKPIFLSIGYAACHWCHVMERECFERPEIAALMNQHFINIKVDREERPDLDDLYMLATQVMSGSGGWPMSVWLTPDLKPFYAGTYFPPADAYGRPGFPRLLTALSSTWQDRRGELLEQAEKVVQAIQLHVDESDSNADVPSADQRTGAAPASKIENQKSVLRTAIKTSPWIRLAIEQAADHFDEIHGGPAGAPKFPPHQALGFWTALLTHPDSGLLTSGEMGILGGKLAKTLDGMSRGGIYDHVGGAFARYSTDERWLVPHFEKMLYDSAQLAPVYAQASLILDNPDYARVARETLDFFLREMQSPEGAFFSSLDADSEGEEGKYYVWTLADIHAALPDPADAQRIIAYFGITPQTNWHETPVPGASVLAVTECQSFTAEIGAALEKMRTFRQQRTRPGLDDKILTSWNGLMLSALALCGSTLHEPRYLRAAEQLATFLLTQHAGKDGRLLRTSRNGIAHTEAFLDDYAYLLNGLVDLAETQQSSPRAQTLTRATALANTMIEDFQDPARGGFYFTGPRHEQLFARMKNAADNATPSANGTAIRALLTLARQTSTPRYHDIALRAITSFATNIARRPEYFPTIMRALVEDDSTSPPVNPTSVQARPPIASPGAMRLSIAPLAPISSKNPFDLTFRLEIASGYHIQPADAADNTIQTVARLRAVTNAQITSQKWTYPTAKNIEGTPALAGTVELKARCTVQATPGPHTLRASVIAQACTAAACLQPETLSIEFPVEII